ncbi:MAG: methanogenesis marker protein Mmp4/MtxX [Candidatus Syntropharchaeales archaeon]
MNRVHTDLFSVIDNSIPKNCKIALGIGDPYILPMLKGVDAFVDLVLVSGSKIELSDLQFDLIVSDKPEEEIVDLLMDGEVDGAVRGSLPASKTLGYLKARSGLKNLARVALLKAKGNDPFLFAPVGIDEGEGKDARLKLIENGIWILESFGVDVKVGILSGGRVGDIGRSRRVDDTLEEGEAIADAISDMGYHAVHHEILIEDAVDESNLIIAPDGISGNLIFRTLTFLGGGSAWGAPVHHELGKIFVDTSRAGGSYLGSVKFAAALSGKIGGV